MARVEDPARLLELLLADADPAALDPARWLDLHVALQLHRLREV